MKFAVLCLLFAAATATNQCYNNGAKMTAYSTGTGNEKTDLLASAPAAEKAYKKATVTTCPAKEWCYVYTVDATATVVVTDAKGQPVKEGDKVKTTTGNMAFEAQNCFSATTAEDKAISTEICKVWDTELAKGFAAEESMKDIVSNIKSTCGKPKKCDGDACVLKADRSSATTFGLSAFLLTLVYLF